MGCCITTNRLHQQTPAVGLTGLSSTLTSTSCMLQSVCPLALSLLLLVLLPMLMLHPLPVSADDPCCCYCLVCRRLLLLPTLAAVTAATVYPLLLPTSPL
jgi:hypothetical protein